MPSSLEWPSGHLDLWQRTRRWHESVAASTRITSTSTRYAVRVDNNARLQRYYTHNLPFYLHLKAASDSLSR